MENNKKEIKTFAVSSKDKKTLFNSSSGGVFYHIASFYLRKLKGAVYGSVLSENGAHHKRITRIDQLAPLMKSKYVRSDVLNTFAECGEDLKNGLDVFYVGLPCQINGLLAYLNNKKITTAKLLTGDLVCHGVPEKQFFVNYQNEIKKLGFIKIQDFRYKKPSWENYSIALETTSKPILKTFHTDSYMKAFLNNYILEEPCYKCPFKGEKRVSDFTMGDFWGIKNVYPNYYDKNGTSLLICRNKTAHILGILRKNCKLHETDYRASVFFNPSYYMCSKKPEDIQCFLSSYEEKGFLLNKNEYVNCKKKANATFRTRIKKFLAYFYNLTYKKFQMLPKKSVGIVTDYGYSNFGNRLQNYALRKKISELGFKPINLCYDKNKFKIFNFISSIKNYTKKQKIIFKESQLSGEKNFYFSTLYKYSLRNLSSIIFGSDQIWNWTYQKNRMLFNLGLLFGNEIPKFSFSASIGTNYIDERYDPLFDTLSANFSDVSVREESAKELLSKYRDDIKVTLDPTFLLSDKEWAEAIKQYSSIKLPHHQYSLKYFLGSNSSAKEKGSIDLLDEESPYYSIGHFDFINFIKNADFIETDSYHAFIFAIIFKKKIRLVCREKMKNRFDYLFKILKISNFGYFDFSTYDTSQLDNLILESQTFLKNIILKSCK